MDDLFENGSDDLGTTGCVAAIQFHKASLPERGWYWRLGDGRLGLVAIRHDPIEQVRQTQSKQIDGFVHHLPCAKAQISAELIGQESPHNRGKALFQLSR